MDAVIVVHEDPSRSRGGNDRCASGGSGDERRLGHDLRPHGLGGHDGHRGPVAGFAMVAVTVALGTWMVLDEIGPTKRSTTPAGVTE